MAVVIRLSRRGAKNNPFYRIVATNKRYSRDGGAYLEVLGTYNPTGKKNVVTVKKDRYDYWVGKGAKASPTVVRLVKKAEAPAAAAPSK